MKLNIRFAPMMALVTSVATTFFGSPAGGGSSAVQIMRTGQIGGGLARAGQTFASQWPLTIALPVGIAFGSGIVRGFGNPGMSLGPVRLSLF